MLSWLSPPPLERVTYEEVHSALRDTGVCIVSTFPAHDQSCLIARTLSPQEEERRLNDHLKRGEARCPIVVYGRNAADGAPDKKCRQLQNLGFTSVRLYAGGLFEWVLLQDIYGAELFPTTSVCPDPLRFKSAPTPRLRLTA